VKVAQTSPAQPEDWPARANVFLLWDCLRPRAGDRKARLFACACLHRLDHLLTPEHRQALRAFEDFADGLGSRRKVRAAVEATPTVFGDWSRELAACESCRWVVGVRNPDLAVRRALSAGQGAAGAVGDWALDAEHRAQCDVLRDVFGHLFTPAVVAPEWLAWDAGTIPKLARTIYEEGAFERMPYLADALEEAGCAAPALLDHCRGGGPHVRGCWLRFVDCQYHRLRPAVVAVATRRSLADNS
jgi:hypothetical protein